MEFGCHLTIFGPAATRANLLTFAREMERLGYDSLWASDHVVVPYAIASRYPYRDTGEFPLPPDSNFQLMLTAKSKTSVRSRIHSGGRGVSEGSSASVAKEMTMSIRPFESVIWGFVRNGAM